MIRAVFCRRLALCAAVLLLLPGMYAQDGRGRKYKPPPPTCKVTVTVIKDKDSKPLEDAAVVFHPIRGNKDEGNMELKTNEDGKVTIDVIPVGDTVRLQVIAEGYQTYGEDYQLPNDTKEITVRLKRPTRQYSIYQNHPDQNGANNQGGANQQGNQPPPQ